MAKEGEAKEILNSWGSMKKKRGGKTLEGERLRGRR